MDLECGGYLLDGSGVYNAMILQFAEKLDAQQTVQRHEEQEK